MSAAEAMRQAYLENPTLGAEAIRGKASRGERIVAAESTDEQLDARIKAYAAKHGINYRAAYYALAKEERIAAQARRK